MLEWQSIYFGVSTSQKVKLLIQEAQALLGKRVVDAAPTADDDLELYTLLEALNQPGSKVSFRVALPNLELLTDENTVENEYDVVAVILRGDKDVEVWVWGVTTEQNLTPKRNSDLAKIQKLKDLLGSRWEADVKVVTCYIHKYENEIRCEIDGRQERRTF
jgi:hypothetical protein